MALFQTVNVTMALRRLVIENADDRWGGVEPYVVPVFYRVDGQRYLATLRILNSLQPRPNTTEVVPGMIQFAVDTLADEQPTDPNAAPIIQEDNPLTYVPPGDLLGRGEFDTRTQVDVSDVSYTTDLIPIPFRIDVLGLSELTPLDALQGLLVTLQGELQVAFNTVFLALNSFIGDLFGLDEQLESCPASDVGSSDFLNNIEAQFKAMIPGTIGGVFVCMENDEFGESLARQVRSSLRDEVKSVLNDTINAIALNNPIPDPELHMNEDDIADNIASDLTWPVVAHVGVALGAIVAAFFTRNPGLGIYGIVSSIGWAVGGLDDTIGQLSFSIDHSDLEGPGFRKPFSAEMNSDGNLWKLYGAVTVN